MKLTVALFTGYAADLNLPVFKIKKIDTDYLRY